MPPRSRSSGARAGAAGSVGRADPNGDSCSVASRPCARLRGAARRRASASPAPGEVPRSGRSASARTRFFDGPDARTETVAVDPATRARSDACATTWVARSTWVDRSVGRLSFTPPPSWASPTSTVAEPSGASAVAGARPGTSPDAAGGGAGSGSGAATGGGAAAVAGGSGAAGGAGSGAGAGTGAGGAAGTGGGEAARGGSRDRGSTYVSASPTLMPRCTYGTSCSETPEGPASATGAPSSTRAPRLTSSVPRCVRDALCPSVVTIVTVVPCVGTWPANEISPVAGARTMRASPSAMSIPRCCPPAYGLSPSANSRRTAPSVGHAQATASVVATSIQQSVAARVATSLVAR